MAKHNHPDYVYAVRDHVLVLMADQAGKPFDYANFRRQFPAAAAQLHIYPDHEPYQFCFNAVRGMVCRKLPKMLPKPSSVKQRVVMANLPVPGAWRDNRRAWNPRDAQLPPSDRE